MGDGVLTLGTLLPVTGSLAFLGPPEVAGVQLAVQEINAAGGVLGKDVVLVEGDSGDTENKVAPTTVQTLLSKNVDAMHRRRLLLLRSASRRSTPSPPLVS